MDGNNGHLLDTNAVIAMQKEDTALIMRLKKIEAVFIPSIVIGELYFGAYKSGRPEINRQTVVQFIIGRVILNCDFGTGDFYGQIKYQLRAKGRPIPENDIWIAAIAKQHKLTLMTRDIHFKEIDGLILETW